MQNFHVKCGQGFGSMELEKIRILKFLVILKSCYRYFNILSIFHFDILTPTGR